MQKEISSSENKIVVGSVERLKKQIKKVQGFITVGFAQLVD
jgi:hypothetical protein